MDFRRVIGSRQGQNLLFRNLFHTLNTCGDGSSFVPTKNRMIISRLRLIWMRLMRQVLRRRLHTKKSVQEHYGFHVTNLNIAQVKQKYGIIERENYNRPKSENSRRSGTTPEKEKAITEALKYFKMI